MSGKSLSSVRKRGDNTGNALGGGRKVGAATTKTRDYVNKILDTNEKLPLDVMYANMLFWHFQAEEIGAKIKELLSVAESEKERATALKLLGMFLEARQQAQQCAVDAAPYFHARLSSITLQRGSGLPQKDVSGNMSPSEAGEAYEAMLVKEHAE